MLSRRTFLGLDAVRRIPRRAVVTIGVFDGVHAAHQRLLHRAVQLAHRLRGTSVAITFDPDPRTVLDPRHASPALMPLQTRVELLRALGIDWVWVIPFTKRFSRLTAQQFLRQILVRRLHAVALVVGGSFAFGHNRRGDLDVLRRLGPSCGIRLVPVPEIVRDGAVVSSSRIRGLIAAGHVKQAARLLGRPAALYGVVVRGTGRGRRLGFPTANIRLSPQAIPPQGVYAVMVSDPARGRRWRGVMNFGVRPTFGPGPVVCEAHLFGFSGTLVGRRVAVSLIARLRGERCFPSMDSLRSQVQRDMIRARRLLARPTSSRSR